MSGDVQVAWMPERGMDYPFIPFTFPTVTFANFAKEKIGVDFTWAKVGRLYGLYEAGVYSGKIKFDPDNSNTDARIFDACRGYMQEVAGKDGLNFASAFAAAVGKGVVDYKWARIDKYGPFGALGEMVKDLTGKVGESAGALVKGLAKGLGIPKGIVYVVIGLIVTIVLYFVYKAYMPRGSK